MVLRDDARQAGGLRQAGGKTHFLQRIARPFGGAAAIGGMGRLGADAGDPQQAEQAFHRIFELVVDMLQNLVPWAYLGALGGKNQCGLICGKNAPNSAVMTDLLLHNTRTRTKEIFMPIDPANVRVYLCGPTVYDRAHIGNARNVVVFDILVRLLRRLYPRVTYVRNITDIDDKINARAKERGESIDAVTQGPIQAYHEDMGALFALPPDIEPRATEHLPEIIAIIEKLIANGHAYEAEGHVLFSVESDKDYGKFSGRSPEDLIAGARVDVAPYKRDAGDFVLWKPSSEDLPGWPSPWGRGRPGWHIECSAMSWKHLGENFDIHGGGDDLIFPHHENEIAQSCCAFPGSHFANVWVHNRMLLVNGEKMSKSLGNFKVLRDVLDVAPGEAVRFLLMRSHYRSTLDFSDAGLVEARRELDRFYRAIAAHDVAPATAKFRRRCIGAAAG